MLTQNLVNQLFLLFFLVLGLFLLFYILKLIRLNKNGMKSLNKKLEIGLKEYEEKKHEL